MKVHTTAIPGVMLLEPRVFSDIRGFFFESYNQRAFNQAGIHPPFVQDNQSFSRGGVLRGLHYQIEQVQGKLVRCVHGEIFDVAVDLRRSSPTYKRWVGEILNSDTNRMLWVPPGFAHGFVVLSEYADVLYKTTDFYAPQHERTLLWNDPEIGIAWPEVSGLTLSPKDHEGLPLAQADLYD